MSNFRKGDTVRRITSDNGGGAKVGQIGTVTVVRDGLVRVWYPGCIDYNRDGTGEGWCPSNCELVGQPKEELEWVDLGNERVRTYIFGSHSKLRIEKARRLCVRPTNHRIETADGRKFIVPGHFIGIEIETAKWSA